MDKKSTKLLELNVKIINNGLMLLKYNINLKKFEYARHKQL